MTALINYGPAMLTPEHKPNLKLDVGFRVIADYIAQNDSMVLRLDILIGGKTINPGDRLEYGKDAKQFNTTFQYGQPTLLMPKHLDGLSVQVNGKELIAKLRALADRLEFELPAE